MSADARSCTVELSTGSLIEVADSPAAVDQRRCDYIKRKGADLMPLPLLTGTSRPDAEYRQEVFVDPRSIAAVYPLDERPLPPRRVYVDRVEAHDRA